MLHNSKILTLATPAYIQFQNLFRTKNYFAKHHSIPKTDLEQVQSQPNGSYTYESLETLYKTYSTETYKNYTKFNNDAMYVYKGVLQAFKENNLDITDGPGVEIFNDFRDCTHFERGFEDWDITHIVRKYKLDAADVFNALVADAMPYNMGVHAYDERKVPKFLAEFKEKVAHCAAKGDKNIYIDYWYGIGIKSWFPIDVHNDETPFKLAIRRYNDRNGDTGFALIIGMLSKSFETRMSEYVMPIEKDLILIEKAPELSYTKEYDIDANSEIEPNKPCEKANSDITYIWRYSIEQKKQNYFNHRNISYPDKPATWDYMMLEFYNKYIRDVPGRDMYLSLAHLFQFSDNTINGKRYSATATLDPNSEYCCSITNMIIYGKVNINWYILERLLPLIRVKFVSSGYTQTTQLDNYVISEISYPGLEGPVYKIDWRDDNVAIELERPKSDYEKLKTAKALYRLMNEIPPELLNFNNYYHVCSWYHRNDIGIQMLSNM